jgi:hypothetical protein
LKRVLVLLASALTLCAAQEWVNALDSLRSGSHQGYVIAVDGQGRIYAGGTTPPHTGNASPTVVRYSPDGRLLWARQFAMQGLMRFSNPAIVVAPSGTVVLAGFGSEYSREALLIWACSSDGDSLWKTVYEMEPRGVGCMDIAADSVGNFYIAGPAGSDSTGADMRVVKLDGNGSEVWARVYDGPYAGGNDAAYAVAVDASGNVYVAGVARNLLNKSKPALLKYSSSGVLRWVRMFGSEGENNGDYSSLALLAQGRVGAAGHDQFTWQAPVAIYSGQGDSVWAGLTDGCVTAAAADHDGAFCATGMTRNSDCKTWKFLSNGSLEWSATYDNPENGPDEAVDIAVDSGNNIVVTGQSRDSLMRLAFCTIKYSPTGQERWVAFYRHALDGLGRGVAVDRSGSVYVTGTGLDSTGSRYIWLTLKYRSSGPGIAESADTIQGWRRPSLAVRPSIARTVCRLGVCLTGDIACNSVIRDAAGRTVRTLPMPGSQGTDILWNLDDDLGQQVPNGVYFVTLDPPGQSACAKIVVQR